MIKNIELLEESDVVAVCRKCDLCKTRNKTVYGEGNPDARLMICGEAGGKDEDLTGKPFIGKAGQLLTEIIKACDWRREDIYICNIIKCRPPNNRTPTAEEVKQCIGYLHRQIEIIKPEYILCLGSVASKALIGLPISEARMTEFHKYKDIPVLATYHPSFALRMGKVIKKEIWKDLQPLIRALNVCQNQKEVNKKDT